MKARRECVIVEDLVERGFVIAAKENVVMSDLLVFFVHAPIEHDGGAGVQFFIEFLRFSFVGQKFLVDVRQVCVANEDISRQFTTVLCNRHLQHFDFRNFQFVLRGRCR